MTPDEYLYGILAREEVDAGPLSPVRGVQRTVMPMLQQWAGGLLNSVAPSGSFAKGTANKSGTDIDLFISLSHKTPETLKQIYESLFETVKAGGYTPRRQNVSINIRVGNIDVDLVPGKQQSYLSQDHSLYRRKADTWTKTNISTHISTVIAGGRARESRILKLWRAQKGLEFPSFYVELAAINGLEGKNGTLSSNVWTMFQYLRDTFPGARVVDPANTNNVVSDDLCNAEKAAVRAAAIQALSASNWNHIVV